VVHITANLIDGLRSNRFCSLRRPLDDLFAVRDEVPPSPAPLSRCTCAREQRFVQNGVRRTITAIPTCSAGLLMPFWRSTQEEHIERPGAVWTRRYSSRGTQARWPLMSFTTTLSRVWSQPVSNPLAF
jgi:hypothetical protein